MDRFVGVKEPDRHRTATFEVMWVTEKKIDKTHELETETARNGMKGSGKGIPASEVET